jgi:hypothetical protein
MITVLVPSRGRPAALRASIGTLLGLAANPATVEVLAGIDPDQVDLYDGPWSSQVRFWVAPERYGHAGIYRYMNHLASLASPGSVWLLNWNDDATMRTPGWDAIVGAQEPAVLWTRANHHEGCNTFPVWPTAWTRRTGHMSLVSNCDSWIQEVGDLLGLVHRIPVEVFHDRHNVTGSGRFDDATAAEGTNLSDPDCTLLRSPEMVAARHADAAAIREIL